MLRGLWALAGLRGRKEVRKPARDHPFPAAQGTGPAWLTPYVTITATQYRATCQTSRGTSRTVSWTPSRAGSSGDDVTVTVSPAGRGERRQRDVVPGDGDGGLAGLDDPFGVGLRSHEDRPVVHGDGAASDVLAEILIPDGWASESDDGAPRGEVSGVSPAQYSTSGLMPSLSCTYAGSPARAASSYALPPQHLDGIHRRGQQGYLVEVDISRGDQLVPPRSARDR